jgi:predicted DNA-binding transcriptional regulator YafY
MAATDAEAKAARLMVLRQLDAQGRLAQLSDIKLAAAFGVERQTIWRDRRALAVAEALYTQVNARIMNHLSPA